MKHIIVMFLTIAAFLCSPLFSSQADVVFVDDFDGENLNREVWRELPQNASGLGYNIVRAVNLLLWILIIHGSLIPSLMALGPLSPCCHAFDPPLSDFNIEFQFSWSSEIPTQGCKVSRHARNLYRRPMILMGPKLHEQDIGFLVIYQWGKACKG